MNNKNHHPWNKIKNDEKKTNDSTSSSTVSFAYIQAEQALEAEEQEILTLALEASLLDNTAKIELVDDEDSHDECVEDLNEEEDVRAGIAGTTTAADCCDLPIAAAYQIDSETSEDERQNRKKGILYTDVLALAPMTKDEIEDETLRLVQEYEKEEEVLRRKVQEEEDASMALILQMQLQDAEEDRKRFCEQNSQHVTSSYSNGKHDHKKIQFVKSFNMGNPLEIERDTKVFDDNEVYTDDENDDMGYRMNQYSNNVGKGVWNRSYTSNSMIVGPNGEIRTKHDVALKNKSNAQRLGLSDADTDGVSDKAFNSFKNKMKKHDVGKGGISSNRVGKGDGNASGIGGKTMEGALDKATLLCIQRAINCRVLETMHGAIKEGKEAIIFYADSVKPSLQSVETKDSKTEVQGNLLYHENGIAVKVFKRIEDFRNRGEYVDGDPRYYNQGKFKSLDKRAQLELWTEKEFRNLTRAYVAGVPTPVPVAYRENVLFMSFLGDNGWPAPQLKEVDSSFIIRPASKRWVHLYCEVMVAIRRLYHCARLVHGDLSEYNILLCSSSNLTKTSSEYITEGGENSLTIALIDFGQAVELKHPESHSLLCRDLHRVKIFFNQRCKIDTLPLDDAVEFITRALDLQSKDMQASKKDTSIIDSNESSCIDKFEISEGATIKKSSLRKKCLELFDFDSEYIKILDFLEEKK